MSEQPVVSAFERFRARVVGVLPAPTARCWLFHKWGAWHAGNTVPIFEGTYFKGVFLIQSRVCERCTRVKLAVSKALI